MGVIKVNSILAAAAIVIFFAAVAFSQNRVGETGIIPSRSFEIVDQTGSPLLVTYDDRLASRVPGALLTVKNVGTGTVNAFVLLVKTGKQVKVYTVFLMSKGIAPGAQDIQGVSIPPVAEDGVKPVISLDLVRFEDGRIWGEDTAGRSKIVEDYIAGHDRALSRLHELLAGQDETDFMKSINTFRSSSFGEPLFAAGRPPHAQDFFVNGYESIINILRRMSLRREAGEALARKLEEMGKTR